MRTLKRILNIVILAVGVVGSLLVLIGFARAEYALWSMRDDRGVHLFAVPRVQVVRAVMTEHGERDGWGLFALGEPAEGTRMAFSFPSWPLVIVATGLLVYAAFTVFEWSARDAA